ncbi:TPA: LacI family DNA-binding transcriptional regulator [Klebsiella aerogenes]|uniref:LacI family DNA-binding transcriptional regulator n=1 Tax=Klebsiella TaxID=570 RepID=UPI001BD1B156|nr:MULTISPECIES: LacI family DNA-binding transcriptional regulator [Klebsiella]ELA2273299.1 LacI family DNA-binding transcriptional regulator [Klebsiella aerogenes]MDU9363882.1 LacI family DNA-binding transcriptional regulator [Klebsiella sp. 141203]HBR7307832.1 LacI family DNA-binding transcriptional regulator [Klebsiella aerogenes]HBW5536588.1 LacI family DNA-binding transcriptional regulator [Klebsiella aerogenes]HCS4221508.1 LacI family DNA-binding transcriptional regulator [Klebsiella aer
MASIKDVAIKAGVSTATVSRVLNNHPSVAPETRKAVREAMDFLCYVPSKSAFQLSGKCSGLIAVVLPNLVNPHFCELLATFEEEARYIGKTVIVKTHQNQPQLDKQIIYTLISMGIDSLLWVPTEAESELAEWLIATNIPVAVVTLVSRFFNSVSIDQSKGAEVIAEHFIQTGHTTFGFVAQEGADNRKVFSWAKRITGQGLTIDKENQFWIAKGEGEKTSGHISILDDIIVRLAERINHCSSLWVYNDVAASYIIDGLKEKGISVPEDIAIASFDNTLLAQTKKITSVAQPISEIAHLAFQMINNETKQESIEMHEIVSRLIIRESSVSINITLL